MADDESMTDDEHITDDKYIFDDEFIAQYLILLFFISYLCKYKVIWFSQPSPVDKH